MCPNHQYRTMVAERRHDSPRSAAAANRQKESPGRTGLVGAKVAIHEYLSQGASKDGHLHSVRPVCGGSAKPCPAPQFSGSGPHASFGVLIVAPISSMLIVPRDEMPNMVPNFSAALATALSPS